MAKFNLFNTVKMPKVKYSAFDLSHGEKTTVKIGELTPVLATDILPGDSFEITPEVLLRSMPMVAPIMDKLDVVLDYFFVPNRILWPGWESFITNKEDAPLHPYITYEGAGLNSLMDHLGFPRQVWSLDEANPFPIAAYFKIYDDYYRDQNLVPDEVFVPLVDGDNSNNPPYWYDDGSDESVGEISCLRRAYAHDYFTAALPFAQKGEDVLIPLIANQTLPVQLDTDSDGLMYLENPDGSLPANGNLQSQPVSPLAGGVFVDSAGEGVRLNPNEQLVVDFEGEANDIRSLRRAFVLQEFLERMARGGSRYIEMLWSIFEVKSSDARLQRAEFLGRSYGSIAISEVLSTAETDITAQSPVGTMSGHGISYTSGRSVRFKAEEHGWLLGILNIQPRASYHQGIRRQFTRKDFYDYALPQFAHIGEQEILNKEIYANVEPGTGTDQANGVWGYIPRYSEYKFIPDRVTGLMRQQLTFWHTARNFTELPTLSKEFIEVAPEDMDKIFAASDITAGAQIIAWVKHNIMARRPLPYYGSPRL